MKLNKKMTLYCEYYAQSCNYDDALHTIQSYNQLSFRERMGACTSKNMLGATFFIVGTYYFIIARILPRYAQYVVRG